MPIRNRTVTVITGAAVATALAGAAAFAAVPNTTDAVTMSGIPARMESFDGDELAEMHTLMDDEGIDLGQMHGDTARTGMDHSQMHRSRSTTTR